MALPHLRRLPISSPPPRAKRRQEAGADRASAKRMAHLDIERFSGKRNPVRDRLARLLKASWLAGTVIVLAVAVVPQQSDTAPPARDAVKVEFSIDHVNSSLPPGSPLR